MISIVGQAKDSVTVSSDSLRRLMSAIVRAKDSATISRDSLQSLLRETRGVPKGTNTLFAALVALVALVGGLWILNNRLEAKQQGFGPKSLKALGLVLFIPTLLVISVVVPNLNAEALAALLGTVAGYVLSQNRSEDT
jgi:hypothetical protein